MVNWKPIPNIKHYQEEMLNGFKGQVEYHLFKDKSWIAWQYRNDQEREKIIAELKKDGYSIDNICNYHISVVYLTNKIEVTLN